MKSLTGLRPRALRLSHQRSPLHLLQRSTALIEDAGAAWLEQMLADLLGFLTDLGKSPD